MCTLLKPLSVRQELLRRGVVIFSPQDFQRIFHTARSKTKYFFETYAQKGVFLRLKKGLYALQSDAPPGEEIANRLYAPDDRIERSP